jgi:hypothetical protein
LVDVCFSFFLLFYSNARLSRHGVGQREHFGCSATTSDASSTTPTRLAFGIPFATRDEPIVDW